MIISLNKCQSLAGLHDLVVENFYKWTTALMSCCTWLDCFKITMHGGYIGPGFYFISPENVNKCITAAFFLVIIIIVKALFHLFVAGFCDIYFSTLTHFWVIFQSAPQSITCLLATFFHVVSSNLVDFTCISKVLHTIHSCKYNVKLSVSIKCNTWEETVGNKLGLFVILG